MLKAITAGKSGRIPESARPGDPWSAAMRRSEDLLTASVFGRLAYLEPSLLWSLLRATFGSALPEFRVAELETVEFWPTWYDPTTKGTVEPDVFMQFKLGDPSKSIALIFEAKLGQHQYPLQWEREWVAYQNLITQGDADADEVFLLAIGGLTGHRLVLIENFSKTIHTKTSGEVSINAVAADWRRLADAVDQHSKVTAGANARILADIGEALALCGYRNVRGLSSICGMSRPQNSLASENVLKKWRFKPD